ncbi:tRNA pseudouridine(13) synthase TruD [Haloparvum sedimenti]|uniref:tRNA pseudouridine(13) synthase TruD n=1 Tax=Haloparvum sedimenti TaxID=1678448 RepID=UPI00071E9D45|nr:tRNA pseudouridine(13) synthase TruD [Haloparvum sedimenti]
MREAHPVERAVGIDHYVSDADGIGGRLRTSPEDFRVRELEAFSVEPLESPTGAYPHLVCRVTLRDWDTNDFVRRLSDAMGISRERVSWAGTKDKRAVTTQLISVRDADPEDLPEVRDAEIEVIGRAGRALTFGDLAGNAFEIRVRDAEPDARERVAAIAADLRAFAVGAENADEEAPLDPDDPVGVPNYFGQQRFGSRRPVTHEVGLAVVRGDWREAVRLYAGNPHESEPTDTREARALVDEQFASDAADWDACLEEMPGKLRFERGMLHRLAEADAPADAPEAVWREALEAVPSNLQRLFVNAAQSALFNRILSERLERGLPFGAPVDGDVACFSDTDAPAELYAPDTDRLQRVSESRVSIVERHCRRDRAFVTAPLVGTETELADGEPGEIEREVLAEAGVEPADFDLPGEFGSTGTRRAILVKTDLSVDDDLTFSFALPSGCYATVLLREFLKSGPLDL